MPNARQASRMLTPFSTVRCAISRRQDGFTTFLQGLLDDLSLEPLLGIHLLEPPVLVFEVLEPGHERGVHAAELAAPFVKRGRTDAVFPAEFGDRATALCLLEYGNDLAV